MPKIVNYSYWEIKQYFQQFDLIVIGSGIVGLSTAINFKEKNKNAKVLILEKGILPSGASTKNAGFACFGSASELLDDLSKIEEETVWKTVEMRWKGLQILQKRLGKKNIDFHLLGGYELFDNHIDFNYCIEKIDYLNKMIFDCIGLKKTYSNVSHKSNQFKKINGLILNKYEGQIDTGLMMKHLIELSIKKGITTLNCVAISKINDLGNSVELNSDAGVFKASSVVVATNGFAKELLNIKDVKPARAQVLITKPIKNLKIKGTFHYQKGYYYFRNINNRILFGGGRNLDFKKETTTEIELNSKIQRHLDFLLKEIILPNTNYEIEHRWSGIMGVGKEKKPIIQFVSKNVLAAVRMGGMGVAIGSLVGEIASEKISEK
jgi:glycine/D-amino acid oxidase-like deaminating enzyme